MPNNYGYYVILQYKFNAPAEIAVKTFKEYLDIVFQKDQSWIKFGYGQKIATRA